MPNFNVVLLEPEIAGNTGNVIRLCANTGSNLHLIEPLGFELDDARLRRAGLDYREYASVQQHSDLQSCIAVLNHPRVFAFSARATRSFSEAEFARGDVLLFGSESAGLGEDVLDEIPPDHQLRVPMVGSSRSLNLSNAVAVVVYEGLRQLDYPLA